MSIAPTVSIYAEMAAALAKATAAPPASTPSQLKKLLGTTNNGAYPMASLYVVDLHPDVTEAQLFEKFSTTGPVLSIRVCRDTITRRSLGYAYVKFKNPADAERAMDTMNFDHMNDEPIRIMWSQRDPSIRRSGAGNIFIKNLDKRIDTKSMYDTFSLFGTILSCKIATDDGGQSRGYGFIHFETEDAALQAIEHVNGMLLDGKKVVVGKFQSHGARMNEFGDRGRRFTNVFVKNFGDEFDDEKLEELFKKHGEIISCSVMKDAEGKSKGFGFVAFSSAEAAEAAVENLDGFELPDTKLKLTVCRAQKKSERQAKLKIRTPPPQCRFWSNGYLSTAFSNSNPLSFLQFSGTKAPEVGKIHKRCHFCSKCRNERVCSSSHPPKRCTNFPNCRYGDKCLFVHPKCKYEPNCKKPTCPYPHTLPRPPMAPKAALSVRHPNILSITSATNADSNGTAANLSKTLTESSKKPTKKKQIESSTKDNESKTNCEKNGTKENDANGGKTEFIVSFDIKNTPNIRASASKPSTVSTIKPFNLSLQQPTSSVPCRFGARCNNEACSFRHPKRCRFDEACTNESCYFWHPKKNAGRFRWVKIYA